MALNSENLKRSEEALRLSEERFAKAFGSSPDAIAISALADSVYIDVNDSVLRLSGYRRDEVIGHAVAELNYVSGYTQNAITHHGMLDVGTAFLQKPFRLSDLARKVGELLDRRNGEISEPSNKMASPASVISRSSRS